jgi:hypothetical protein
MGLPLPFWLAMLSTLFAPFRVSIADFQCFNVSAWADVAGMMVRLDIAVYTVRVKRADVWDGIAVRDGLGHRYLSGRLGHRARQAF